MDAWSVDRIYDTLITVNGRRADKIVTERQFFLLSDENRAELRQRLIKAIEGEFKADGQVDTSKDRTRAWLLSSLARIQAGDSQTMEFLEKRLLNDCPECEKDKWTRYWILEGMVASCFTADTPAWSKIREASLACKATVEKIIDAGESANLVLMLGYTILAASGDRDSLEKLRAGLQSPDTGEDGDVRAVLRALRIIPHHGLQQNKDIFDYMANLINLGEPNVITYDAIFALGILSLDSPQRDAASEVLMRLVRRYRSSALHDGMRSRALLGLGYLKATEAVSVIVGEFMEDNPSIARDAARALKQALSIPNAVQRIVEQAAQHDRQYLERFASALRWMGEEEAITDELDKIMFSDEAQFRDVARELLSRMGGTAAFKKLRARQKITDEYWKLMQTAQDDVKNLFKDSIAEAQMGFKSMRNADAALFYVGLIIMVMGFAAALLFNLNNIANFVTSLGVTAIGAGISYWFKRTIDAPRERMQESVNRIMYQKAVFLAYLRQLYQVDQAYALQVLGDDRITMEEAQSFKTLIEEMMQSAITKLNGQKDSAQKTTDSPGAPRVGA
jgi:hypothetical protein